MRKLLLILVLTMGTPALMNAQELEEHLYEFLEQGLDSPYEEKVFTELMVGLDPNLKVSHDPQLQQVRILAYRPLDLEEVINLAAQMGVTLNPL